MPPPKQPLKRSQRNDNLPCELTCDPSTQENAAEKLNKYLAAKKEYEEAYIKENYGKQTPVEEFKSTSKSILKASGKLIDNFFKVNGEIANSVERDIYNHSLQRKFNNLALDALYYKDQQKKQAAKRKTTKQTGRLVVVPDINGIPRMVNVKDVQKSTRTRTRRY